MASSAVLRTFAAGELSKAYASRADLPQYGAGLRVCRNWVVRRSGGASNRAGTRFAGACKTTSENVRLLRYESEIAGESVLIEFGEGYLRFFQAGSAVTVALDDVADYDIAVAYVPGDLARSSGVPYVCLAPTTGHAPPDADFWFPLEGRDDGSFTYEIPCPFSDAKATKTAQSGRLITFTSQTVKPHDLHYEGLTRWWFDFVAVAPSVTAPTDVGVVSDGTSSAFHTFQVVALSGSGSHRSTAASWSGGVTPDASGPTPITIAWEPPGPIFVDMDPIDSYDVYADGAFIGNVLAGTETTSWDGTPGSGGVDEGDNFTPSPENVTAEGTGSDPSVAPVRYVVTAIDPLTGQESLPSEPGNGDLPPPSGGNPHRVTWAQVTVGGALVSEYRVYVDFANGGPVYYVGQTALLTFINTGITQDTSRTPPTVAPGVINPDDPTTFPAVSGYFQQRRFFGCTTSEPDRIRASKVADYSNFTVSSPIRDDDAISFRIAGNNNHAVRRFIALTQILVLTDSGEWRVRGDAAGVLTPSSIGADQEMYAGLDDLVAPIVIGNTIVYVQARGKIMRDLRFSQQVQGLAGRDLTTYASHLFDKYTLVAMDFQQSPDPIVWVCRSDGTLLGLTYLPELETFGWHRHDTGAGGDFEDVCIVPETDEDAVYLLVRRDINGSEVRYIERMASRVEARTFLDCALDYVGDPIGTFGGLDHLEGETVTILADGVITTAVVVSGQVSVGGSRRDVVVGLPITADLVTVDLDAPGTDVRGKKKSVKSVALVLEDSSRNFKAGPRASKLRAFQPASNEVVLSADDADDLVELTIDATFDFKGRVFLRQDKPTAMTVLGILPYVEVGG